MFITSTLIQQMIANTTSLFLVFTELAEHLLRGVKLQFTFTLTFFSLMVQQKHPLVELSPATSDKDIMFGILRSKNELFINHILIVAKQYLYSCRQNKSLPSIKVFNSKIKMIHQFETMIAKSNKPKAYNMKWGKYKNN